MIQCDHNGMVCVLDCDNRGTCKCNVKIMSSAEGSVLCQDLKVLKVQ